MYLITHLFFHFVLKDINLPNESCLKEKSGRIWSPVLYLCSFSCWLMCALFQYLQVWPLHETLLFIKLTADRATFPNSQANFPTFHFLKVYGGWLFLRRVVAVPWILRDMFPIHLLTESLKGQKMWPTRGLYRPFCDHLYISTSVIRANGGDMSKYLDPNTQIHTPNKMLNLVKSPFFQSYLIFSNHITKSFLIRYSTRGVVKKDVALKLLLYQEWWHQQ